MDKVEEALPAIEKTAEIVGDVVKDVSEVARLAEQVQYYKNMATLFGIIALVLFVIVLVLGYKFYELKKAAKK